MDTVKVSKLNNDLKIIKVPQAGTEAITVMLLVPVGSRYETKTNNGISHFLEHLMFKGTTNRPTTLDISKELDGVGAEYNAYTAKDHTVYYIKVAAKHTEIALDLFSDMLFHSLFDANEIQRERGVILEELNMYEDNPLLHLETLLEMAVFDAQHPLGFDIGGIKRNIKVLSRELFINFKKIYYTPNRMHLCLAGHIPTNVDRLIKRYFGLYQAAGKRQTFKQFVKQRSQPRLIHQYKDTQQTQLGLGFVALPYLHKNLPTLTVLATILGGNMSSRLFINIRERQGLCYVIRTEINSYMDTGIFAIQAGLDNARLSEALHSLMYELKRVKQEPVTAEELTKAKEFIKGQLTLRLEDSSTLASWYGRQSVLTGMLISPMVRMKQIDQVTVQDIQRVANQIITKQHLHMASIGPHRSINHLRKLLIV